MIELFHIILKKVHQKSPLRKNKMNYNIVQLSTDSQYSWSVALNL